MKKAFGGILGKVTCFLLVLVISFASVPIVYTDSSLTQTLHDDIEPFIDRQPVNENDE